MASCPCRSVAFSGSYADEDDNNNAKTRASDDVPDGDKKPDATTKSCREIDDRLLFMAYKIHMLYNGGWWNPHITPLLEREGFVFNINLWIAERPVETIELHCAAGADINMIG